MNSARVSTFVPATTGLHYSNAFPTVPLLTVPVPRHGAIRIRDAANGLCGGMAFAVRDCFEAHRLPPSDAVPPPSGSAACDYLVGWLIDSFGIPAGPLRFIDG